MRSSIVKHRRWDVRIAFLFLIVACARTSAGDANVRFGIACRDARGQSRAVSHAEERFAMCSTFKFLAAAAVLHRVDHGREKLDRFIKYSERDLLAWAPITKQHVQEGGMNLEALCSAAIAYSDNTAANLLLQTLGGPSGVTEYARTLGDKETRLDRTEPDLNDVTPGDPRDTTTPMAMLRDMEKVLLGDALSQASREKLESWMTQNTTGDGMIRAALPKDWRIGDKTGRNGNANGNSNDIAILRPPKGGPLLIAIFLEMPGARAEARNQAIVGATHELLDNQLRGAPTP